MVTPDDILTVINEMLVVKYKSLPVYIDRIPEDFKRPSFCIECPNSRRADVNRRTVSWLVQFVITCFLETNDYGHSDVEALLVRKSEVMDLFRFGFVEAGDRRIKLTSLSGASDMFAAEIKLQFDYYDDRDDTPDDTPLMETVITKIIQEV